MPDASKFAELRRMGYEIPPTCRFCEAADIDPKGDGWGTCLLHEYTHEKHTGSARQVSIHESGSCPDFVHDRSKSAKLGAHLEFFRCLE